MSAPVESPLVESPPACHARPPRRPVAAVVAALAVLIAAVYLPVLKFEFVDFDTFEQVVANPYIRTLSLDNVKHILTTRCITSYYPVRTLTFALDHALWGLHAGGFKLTNVLIHLANAVLVFWLVLRLGDVASPGAGVRRSRDVALAGFAGGLFAMHPVMVEPVVWIPGREELLMGLGALGTIHFHIAARVASDAGKSRKLVLAYHGASVFCCAAACLSNAVGAVIPMLVLAWDVLMLRKVRRDASQRLGFCRSLARIALAAIPLWTIAAATIVTKVVGDSEETLELVQLTWAGRAMVGLSAYGLHLRTLAWPDHLCLHYDWLSPRGFSDPDVLVGIVAAALTLVVLGLFRRRPLVVLGLFWFGLAMAPTLQIIPHHIHRADRFLYMPLVGIAVAVAMALRPLVKRINGRAASVAATGFALAVVATMAARTTFQIRTWQTSLGVWQHCLALNPHNARAHDVVADHFARQGCVEQAIKHYETVLALRPYAVETLENYGYYLATWDPAHRDYDRAVELVERARAVVGGRLPTLDATLADIHASYAYHLQKKGQFAHAIRQYELAIQTDPNHVAAAYNFALLLATCPDEKLRQPEEAVRLAEWAQGADRDPDINAFLIMATVYARARRFGAAAVALQSALDALAQVGDVQMAADLRLRLSEYQKLAVPATAPGSETRGTDRAL